MLDLQMMPGESLRIDHTITNKDGTPRDISGANGTFIVYDAPRGTTKLTGTFAMIEASLGTAVSVLDDSATDIYANEYHVFYYLVKLNEADGTETILEKGKLTIG